jgi:hypothetical protein
VGLLAVALAGLGALAATWWLNPAVPALDPPGPAELRAGGKETFSLHIKRGRYAAPVSLVFTDVPPDLTVRPGREIPIAGDAEDAAVVVEAAPRARPGERTVRLRLGADGPEVAWALTVKPLATLPARCEPPDDQQVERAADGKYYYRRIVCPLPDGTAAPFLGAGTVGAAAAPAGWGPLLAASALPPGRADAPALEFLLVRQEKPREQPTFYIMRDPVTNAQFARFAALNPAAVQPSWTRGAMIKVARPGGQVEALDVGNQDPRLPVLRVTLEEALRFARWLQGKGPAVDVFDVPTAREYDKAAGFYVGQKPPVSPLDPGWARLLPAEKIRAGVWFAWQGQHQWDKLSKADRALVGVGRIAQGPMPVGEPTLDVSPCGCRHLAANGREYTTTLAKQPPGKEHLDLERLALLKERPNSLWVDSRGKSFWEDKPSFWRYFGADDRDVDYLILEESVDSFHDVTFRLVLRPGGAK